MIVLKVGEKRIGVPIVITLIGIVEK